MVGAALLLAAAVSAPGPIVLVNAAGGALEELSIRPSQVSASWERYGAGRLSQGARASMPSPGGQLCAFDIRARVGGAPVTWVLVNLCDVKSVTLNRRPDGTLWADYD